MLLAAPDDTWGIAGPTFLTAYLLTAAALVAFATLHRTVVLGGGRDAFTAPMGPQQAAYLNGGPRLALYSSLAGLRAAGVIGSSSVANSLVTTGAKPLGLTQLDNAVYDAAHRKIRTRDLGADAAVRNALDGLRASLESAGFALSNAQRGSVRLWGFAALLLVGVGFLRVVDGMRNDKPFGYLILATFAMFAVAILLIARIPMMTRAGRSAVKRLRRDQAHLAPARFPALATYGAPGAAMGVALFGAASLWAMDPAFAAEAEIQRQTAASGYSGSSNSCGGSSSSDGGSSSSCGGGGGCGGGGCGG